jgi:hypothetical protein
MFSGKKKKKRRFDTSEECHTASESLDMAKPYFKQKNHTFIDDH